MSALRAVARKVAGVLFPWQPKHEREAAIAAAREGRERSQASAAQAAVIGRQIEASREENNFARAVAAAFRGDR